MLADFVDRADIRVVERGGGLRLALEALERARIAGQVCRKEFQSDEAVQACVFCFINHPHPSTAEAVNDAVVGDGLPDQ